MQMKAMSTKNMANNKKMNTYNVLEYKLSRKTISNTKWSSVGLLPVHTVKHTFSYTTMNVRGLKIEQLSRDPAFEA